MRLEISTPWKVGLCAIRSNGREMMEATVVFLFAQWVDGDLFSLMWINIYIINTMSLQSKIVY